MAGPPFILQPGTIVRGYRVEERLGVGGMGEVWRAVNVHLASMSRAVKVIRPELAAQPEFRARFLREGEVLNALNHPNLLRIFDIGEEQGMLFLSTELLQGSGVDVVLKQAGRLESVQVARIGAQALAGLAEAHRQRIVHRDIKPSNLFLEAAGNLKVLDFGIARGLHAGETITRVGDVVGSPAYFAPEFADGEPASAASDVYSTGISLFQLLTGRLPFRVSEQLDPVQIMAALMIQHATKPLPDLRALQPAVAPRLVEAIEQATAKRPEARPSAKDLSALLASISQASIGRAPPDPPPPSPPSPPPAPPPPPAAPAAPAPAAPSSVAATPRAVGPLLAALSEGGAGSLAVVLEELERNPDLGEPPGQLLSALESVPLDAWRRHPAEAARAIAFAEKLLRDRPPPDPLFRVARRSRIREWALNAARPPADALLVELQRALGTRTDVSVMPDLERALRGERSMRARSALLDVMAPILRAAFPDRWAALLDETARHFWPRGVQSKQVPLHLGAAPWVPAAASLLSEGEPAEGSFELDLEPESVPSLVALGREEPGLRLLLDAPVLTLGRASAAGGAADLVLQDVNVSRRHLRLEIAPDRTVRAEDVGAGGTFRNGERFHTVELKGGDRLLVGAGALRFVSALVDRKPRPRHREAQGAFFWFDAERISEAGHGRYGTFAYQRLLPHFGGGRRGSWVFFDGDFLPQGAYALPSSDAGERAVAQSVVERGSYAYAIAVHGDTRTDFGAVDSALRASTGEYMGMLSCPAISRQEFLALRAQTSLVASLRLEDGRLQLIDFTFLERAALEAMGFRVSAA